MLNTFELYFFLKLPGFVMHACERIFPFGTNIAKMYNKCLITTTANTKHFYNIFTTSAQRLRRWSNFVKCYANVLCLLGTLTLFVERAPYKASANCCNCMVKTIFIINHLSTFHKDGTGWVRVRGSVCVCSARKVFNQNGWEETRANRQTTQWINVVIFNSAVALL